MDCITINTNLNNFILLDQITEVGASSIQGTRHFADVPVYLGMESLAQLGALHVRYITGFARHAFLLKIIHFEPPARQVLSGGYHLRGALINRSGRAFGYTLQAGCANEKPIKGEFLFATVEYGQDFKMQTLQDHYRKVFACLRRGSKKDC